MHDTVSCLHASYLFLQLHINQLFFGFLHPLKFPPQPLHLLF